MTGDSTADTVAGAQVGKNAVENNLLGGGTEDGQIKAAQEHAKNIMSCADNPGSASCQKGLAMQDALMVAIPAGLRPPLKLQQPRKQRYRRVRVMWCCA
ncbi:VENN motif pre-toxin domain-containing protein [Yersinia proxima]|uniref:VENN motif pre-toxin domain-containing protein n=1 Tax=Yersinia proxima TaxID=2890316 RepID=UPI00223516B7|nr:VENN motif pre-toxin domain-containing protein [Yersinia proxima]